MMFPSSFFQISDSIISGDLSPVPEEECVTPGRVYRDCLAFGTTPSGVEGCLFDDDDCDLLDAASDLTVQKTDLVDKSFYRNNPDYQTPSSLKKQDLAPTSSTPTAPPAGDSAVSSDLSQPSTTTVE